MTAQSIIPGQCTYRICDTWGTLFKTYQTFLIIFVPHNGTVPVQYGLIYLICHWRMSSNTAKFPPVVARLYSTLQV